jgi:methyltransferase (TIGR00027 family)
LSGDRPGDEESKGPIARAGRALITLLRVLLYIPIQIAFIPIAIVGILVGIQKGIRRTRQMGVSFSAVRALHYRWFGHYLTTRPDPLSVAFMKEFPCESHFGLWSIVAPLLISRRLFRFAPNLGRLPEPGRETLASTPGRRLLIFDEIMERAIDEVEQIVLPGIGFDLIALRSTEGRGVRVFELDQVETLNVKIETLKRAGIRHDWITYIPVDYSRESWVDKLLEAGFDRTKKALFLWQSVSLFLEADVVKENLKQMAALCVDGSRVAQDFYSSDFAAGEIARTVKKTSGMMERMGEPWKFGIGMGEDPRGPVEAFLGECGLRVTELHEFGEKMEAKPFYCIVESSPELTLPT